MLTINRDIAEGFARREPPGDRAVITYRVPACQVDTYLHTTQRADLGDYALKVPLPGSMITEVDIDIQDP